MALKRALHRGDWVKVTSKTGCVIVGQAAHDMHTAGYARLTITIGGDDTISHPSSAQNVSINVNFWDVETINHNLIPEYPDA